MKKYIKKIKTFFKTTSYTKSYSQTGEDMIINFIFRARNISMPTFIDIGAYRPKLYSNTYFFYSNGSRGINIEPNPIGYKEFLSERPKDINLNFGIADKDQLLDYFVMNEPSMNTFDSEYARELENNFGFRILSVMKIPVKTLTYVIENYHGNVFPDFLSLDVEGLDLEILKSIDYTKGVPKVICVESIEYSNNAIGKKQTDILSFLLDKNYFIFADTYINTIFVHNEFWYSKENL